MLTSSAGPAPVSTSASSPGRTSRTVTATAASEQVMQTSSVQCSIDWDSVVLRPVLGDSRNSIYATPASRNTCTSSQSTWDG